MMVNESTLQISLETSSKDMLSILNDVYWYPGMLDVVKILLTYISYVIWIIVW